MSAPLPEHVQHLASRLYAGAITALQPRNDVEIYDWAEERIRLSKNVTKDAGRLVLRSYQKGEWSPLWAWRRYSIIDVIWPTQVGKTLLMQVIAGYCIDVDPGPMMIVFPNESLVRRRSRKHLQPFIRECLPESLTDCKHDFKLDEYALRNMTINLAHSGSPAQVAGEPIRYLLMDETAKFAPSSEKEPGAELNARERTKSYRPFAREWSSTTPTLESEPGWRNWQGSTQCQFWVPCPCCGESQPLYFGQIDYNAVTGGGELFAGGVKWDANPELSLPERLASAYYQCAHCEGQWNDYQLNRAVDAGEWRAMNPDAAQYACHLCSLVAPSIKLADMLETWFKSYKDPEKRRLFLNSWCAVYFAEEGQKASDHVLKSRILPDHRAGTVPQQAVALFLSVDVHDDHLRYRVRAWDQWCNSWGVEEGQLLPDMDEIEKIMGRTYMAPDGPRYIDRVLIDSGWRTDEVYQFCLRHSGVAFPVKGGKFKNLWQPVKRNVVADPLNDLPLGGEIILIEIDDFRAKNLLFSMINIEGNDGQWHLEAGIDEGDYIHQMQGEEKRAIIKKGKAPIYEWVLVHDNHALDCEKYNMIMWHVFKVGDHVPPPADTAPADEAVNPYTKRPVGQR